MLPKLIASCSASKSTWINLSPAGEKHAMTRHVSKARSKLNVVDEEYKKTLRTKSFLDIWSKLHHNLKRSTTSGQHHHRHHEEEEEEEEKEMVMVPELTPSPLPHLLDSLIDPSQDSVLSLFQEETPPDLLLDYFDATLQAFTACASVLSSLDLTRCRHRAIHHHLLRLSDDANSISELTSLLDLPNPLAPQSLSHFHRAHNLFDPLTLRLTSAGRKIKQRARRVHACKKASKMVLVAACTAVAVAALAVAAHAIVAFGVISAVPAMLVRPRQRGRKRGQLGRMERENGRVDAAARGAYIVGRVMDTMSRMVRRAGDEVEHGRDVARMAVRNGERHLVREVVRELKGGEEGFERQLEEVEEHVYVCLLTINRSRWLVAQEMVSEGGAAAATPSSTAM